MSGGAKPIRFIDLIPHVTSGIRLCVKCKFRGMNEYQDYYGSEIMRLPSDIIKTLYVEKITIEMDYSKSGIHPILILTISDEMTIITFDPEGLFQRFQEDLSSNETRNDTDPNGFSEIK